MLKLDCEDDLITLVKDDIAESLTLDYKRSNALSRDNTHRDELTKDISAFANSAGGQINYGIVERNRKPVEIDEGVDPSLISREWIEQTIDSRIHPRIEGFVIKPIPLKNNFAYVLAIPQAVTRAPHQAFDHKYYKRHNFQSVPMEDYEIRDIFRRSTVAEPFLEIHFRNGNSIIDVEPEHGMDHTAEVPLKMTIGNRSTQPAFYTVVSLWLDDRLRISAHGGFVHDGSRSFGNDVMAKRLTYKMGIPGAFPLFKEVAFSVPDRPLSFRVPNVILRAESDHPVSCS